MTRSKQKKEKKSAKPVMLPQYARALHTFFLNRFIHLALLFLHLTVFVHFFHYIIVASKNSHQSTQKTKQKQNHIFLAKGTVYTCA